MTNYDHYIFCEEMAARLLLIGHTSGHERFFRASGGQLYTSLDERLSSIDSPVLIAVDKGETSTVRNGSDGLLDTLGYAVIIAIPTDDCDVSTIHNAEMTARDVLLQVRNVLVSRFGNLVHDFQMTPSGAIGDNFYGEVLEYRFDSFPVYSPDQSYFLQDEPAGEES